MRVDGGSRSSSTVNHAVVFHAAHQMDVLYSVPLIVKILRCAPKWAVSIQNGASLVLALVLAEGMNPTTNVLFVI